MGRCCIIGHFLYQEIYAVEEGSTPVAWSSQLSLEYTVDPGVEEKELQLKIVHWDSNRPGNSSHGWVASYVTIHFPTGSK